ncbi:tetratricopeptide repeat protein [Tissierella sp. MSJ-40]|uniref:Tetratricopeptide repeat protein n=1 Tax=Tissierella simiarum TaxID=2841534 RepID=A0ABS6EBS3_9FIRM|nr:tetratricopeptide repeat protein [Tissierella simiarum]MBU5440232.1 tetratricopeptide repeat protein [Tissierella simiarum]
MDLINKYFKNKANNITFIELRQNSSIKINDYTIKEDIPLPIITDTLVKEIKSGNVEEEINIGHLMEGIIYLIGVDPEFKYINEYKNILKAYDKNLEDYIFYKGIKLIEEKKHDEGAIYFRALKAINPNNVNAIFNYALTLEEIAKKYFDSNKEKEGNDFLIKSTNELESILDITEEYPLSYYKLGYHYKYFEQFLKSKLIWKKYLKLDKDELRLQEIREQLELIDDDVEFESGLTYLTYGDYKKSLDIFLKLAAKHNNWWKIFYLIGLSYKGLGEYDTAIDYFYEALELNNQELDIYNELGICLFTIGDINSAIKSFSQGIDINCEDYKLLFNRGLAYMQLGIFEKALEDIEIAYKLNPHDNNIEDQRNKIKILMEQ